VCARAARRCQVVAPCCGHTYACQKCHDAEEDHALDPAAVATMRCMACGLRQPSAGVGQCVSVPHHTDGRIAIKQRLCMASFVEGSGGMFQ
jgi:hypothetical protein